MSLAWTPDQIEIYNLLAKGKAKNKEVVAAGFARSLVSKVRVAMEAGETPPERIPPTPTSQKPKITGEGDEQIKEHWKGYEKDGDNIVFILNSGTGRIIDFRLKYPLVFPMYELCQDEPISYGGSFDQFLADMIESMFAALGWELSLAPKSQKTVYEEVVRLQREGAINVIYDDDGKIKLEVANADKGEHTKSRAGPTGDNDKPAPKVKRRQKQPAKPE